MCWQRTEWMLIVVQKFKLWLFIPQSTTFCNNIFVLLRFRIWIILNQSIHGSITLLKHLLDFIITKSNLQITRHHLSRTIRDTKTLRKRSFFKAHNSPSYIITCGQEIVISQSHCYKLNHTLLLCTNTGWKHTSLFQERFNLLLPLCSSICFINVNFVDNNNIAHDLKKKYLLAIFTNKK